MSDRIRSIIFAAVFGGGLVLHAPVNGDEGERTPKMSERDREMKDLREQVAAHGGLAEEPVWFDWSDGSEWAYGERFLAALDVAAGR